MKKIEKWYQSAFQQHQAGSLEDAKKGYRKVLRKESNHFDALHMLGTLLAQRGEPAEGAVLLKKAYRLRKNDPYLLNNLALALEGIDEESYKESEGYYREAIKINSEYSDAWSKLGGVLGKQKCYQDAVDALSKAVVLDPESAIKYYNLGLMQIKVDDFVSAEKSFLEAIKYKADFAEAFNDLATVYKAMENREEDAEVYVRQAIKLRPDFFDAWNNLGAILQQQWDRDEEALTAYDKALELNPEHPLIPWNKCFIYLQHGNLIEGWPYFEYRWSAFGVVPSKFPWKEWRGGESLEGKKILVYGEQGVGDELLFSTCIPDVIKQAEHCVIACFPKLAPIFERSFPEATIIGAERDDYGWVSEVGELDYQVPMGTLAPIFRSDISLFPEAEHHLQHDTRRGEKWSERVRALGDGLKVGLCWRSSLVSGTRYKGYAEIQHLAPLFSILGVQWVNLQYDDCDEELRYAKEQLGAVIHHFSEIDMYDDLDETASLISALDLVLSPGTAVDQLAASIGVPSIIMLNWGGWVSLGSEYNPWFPMIRYVGETDQHKYGETVLMREMIPAVANMVQELVDQENTQVPLFQWGLEFYKTGRKHLAQSWCERILHKKFDHADALHLLGIVQSDFGLKEQSCENLKKAVNLVPDNPEYWLNLSNVEHDLHHYEEAISGYKKVIAIQPDFSEAFRYLGMALKDLGDLEEAEIAFSHAIQLSPKYAAVWNDIGLLKKACEEFESAKVNFEKALEIDPDFFPALYNLANYHLENMELDRAGLLYHKLTELSPHDASVWHGLGSVAVWTDGPDTAATYFEKSITLKPDFFEAHWAYAFILFTQGRLRRGWEQYEARKLLERTQQPAYHLPIDDWKGESLLGKTILVYAEQGVGDEIMFASCLPDLVKLANCCILECDPRLVSIFQRSFPEVRVHGGIRDQYDWMQDYPDVDYKVASGSLPQILRPDIHSFPKNNQYLEADEVLRKHWNKQLEQLGNGFKIGITWRSGTIDGQRKFGYPYLKEYWRLLAEIPTVTLVNLQYGDTLEEREFAKEQWGIEVHHFEELDLKDDFEGTAALICELDLVITVGNAVNELTGALGQTSWLMLPTVFGGIRSLGASYDAWHPSIHYFYPEKKWDWDGVFVQLSSALKKVVNSEGLEYISETEMNSNDQKDNQLVEGRYGAFLYSPDGSDESVSMEYYGEFLQGIVPLLQNMLQSGQWVLDIGSGAGLNAVIMSAIVGTDGGVVAIEPERLNYQRLCANAMLANRMNIHAIQAEVLLGGSSSTEGVKLSDLQLSACDLIRVNCDLYSLEIIDELVVLMDAFKPLLLFSNVAESEVSGVTDKLNQMNYQAVPQEIQLYNQDNFLSNEINVFSDKVQFWIMAIPTA